MHRINFCMLTLAMAISTVAAEAAGEADARAAVVAPYVDAQTLAVVRFDFTRIDVEGILNKFNEAAKIDAQELAPIKQIAGTWVADFKKAGGKDLFIVLSMADLPGTPFVIAPLTGDADATALTGLFTNGPLHLEAAQKFDGALVAGSRGTLSRLKMAAPAPRPDVAKAFAAAGDGAVQLLFLPTPELRRLAQEVSPTLPNELGGGSIAALTQGVEWAAAGVELAPQAALKLTIQSKDAAAAGAFQRVLNNTYQAVARAEMPRRAIPSLDKALALLTPTVKGDQLNVSINSGAEGAGEFLAELASAVTGASQRVRSANSLKKIGFALHTYHDANGKFPTAAGYSKDGQPLLSWRVHILPFIEQTALYNEFHLDEPWDSEHNKKLIPRMPKIYAGLSVAANQEGKTRILAPVGPAMMFTGTQQPVQMKEVTDGTSNTILAVEALPEQAVVWTKPDDLKIDPKGPIKGLLDDRSTGFNALFADGSVHFLSAKIDAKVLYALFTRNGGEVVTTDF
jgi:prepilin-type processing-associated H-X9-DG protein